MLSIQTAFPLNQRRQKSLYEFDKSLRESFDFITKNSDPVLRDNIHFHLFKVKDRFSSSCAWIVAQDASIPQNKIAPVLSALEMVRCAFGAAESIDKDDSQMKLESVLCLISMATSLVFDSQLNPELSEVERASITKLFTTTLSPIQIFSKQDEKEFHQLDSFFDATGFVFDLFSKDGKKYRDFFNRLGQYSILIQDFAQNTSFDYTNIHHLSWTQAMEKIKTLESELKTDGKKLDIEKTVDQLISPLSDLFNIKLQ